MQLKLTFQKSRFFIYLFIFFRYGSKSYLKDCTGAVHLQLIVVAAQVFYQVLYHSLGLDGDPVVFLRQCKKKKKSSAI